MADTGPLPPPDAGDDPHLTERRLGGTTLLTASINDYALPHADGFRGFKTAFDTRIPCLTNALGVKGVGELGTIGTSSVAAR